MNELNNQFDPGEVITGFDELPFWSAPFGLKLLEAVEYKPNITALDIGFGAGFPLTELAMRLGNRSIVYGIDPWEELVERARVKIGCYGISNIRIIEGVAESIPLPNHSVDLITSNNGINNVRDIDKVLSECARILKPGGQFLQTMNLEQSMFEFYGQMKHVLEKMGLHKEIEQMYEHIAHKRPAIEKIKAWLQKHGFIIKELEYDQFNYRFTDGTAMLNHYFIRLAFMDSWKALLPMDKADEVFNQIEQGLNEYARNYGGLKLSIPFALINVTKGKND
ncbi:MAG: class I SAM-dependent methyltransferase [Tannerellaceae bacterium]|jgi:ubiquinone/menaquinone biosynthesis C-methylase UbiE|nr:class I SAM-dependent methyltransferase [Tannerellaceae bacterium]